jgi:hypothetical protein
MSYWSNLALLGLDDEVPFVDPEVLFVASEVSPLWFWEEIVQPRVQT